MRKILYSPGYGAGWTTWGGDTPEQKRFMLEYKPFVDFIEGGGKFPRYPDGDPLGGKNRGETHPLVAEFKAEWKRRWPSSVKVEDGVEYGYPCFLGLEQLRVERVRIDEYDGSESVAVEGEDDGQWL